MRKMTLIRWGAASVLLGCVAVGALAAACSDNHSAGAGDASAPDVKQPPPGDDTDAGDAAPPIVHGKVVLVHASAFAPALRFCFGSVNNADPDGGGGRITIAPGFAAPNSAVGVPPGTGGPVTLDLAYRTLEIYAISAVRLAGQVPSDAGTELTCDELIGSKATSIADGGLGLALGTDYWDLGRLPSRTLADGTTTLLAVTGCAPGETNNAMYNCPMPYDGATGNLGMWTAKLDTTTALDGGSIGAQFANASYPFSSLSSQLGGVAAVAGFYVTTTFVPEAGAPADGGGPAAVTAVFPVAEGVTYRQLAPSALVPVPGVTFDGTSGFFVNSVTADGGPTPLQVPIPLPSIQALSAPGTDAGIFADGAGYVFVLVGDPAKPSFVVPDGGDAGQFNLLSVHILAFSTSPSASH